MKSILEVLAPLTRRRRWLGVVALLVAVGAVTAMTVQPWSNGDDLPKDAAFSYRGTVVTVAQLEARVHVLGALYGVAEPRGTAARDKFWRAAAQADAMSLILEHAAATDGIVITQKQADAVLQQMITTQLTGSNAQAAFDAILKKFGVSQADVLLEVKRQQQIGQLFQRVTQRVAATPSAADLMAYFQAHSADFGVPQQRHLLNIVVGSRSQAEAIVQAAKTTSFGTLANRYSLDGSTRLKGGDLGTVAASTLDAAYAKVAFAAAPGAVFGPVHTTYGWNVGKVVSVVAARPAAFAVVRGQVASALQSSRALATWRAWLAQQVARAGVRYASAYRPADPTRLPAINLPTGS